jgi:hypothetical protein
MLLNLLSKIRIPFLLLLVCYLAYLPLSSFLFSLKNDAFAYNFPNKYFFSEALRAGQLPLWNPYLNFGFPLYADPGFAWWNPISWFWGLIGYNAYTFTLEILGYIYISGIGMYWCLRKMNFLRSTSFAIACMFMCSGFFIGNVQHINFLTCAAFIPWVIGSWILYQRKTDNSNLLRLVFFSFMLITGGHPAIPLAAAFYLLVLSPAYFIIVQKEPLNLFIKKQLLYLIMVSIAIAPLLFSYWQIWPFYSRNQPVDQLSHLDTGFTFQSYISFFYPFATIKNSDFFATDVSMRNAYFSLAGIALFMAFLLQKKKEKLQLLFLWASIPMIIISLGGEIKNYFYSHLPGFSYINTNGEFRVFIIFSLLFVCGFELNKILLTSSNGAVKLKKIFLWLMAISLLSAIITIPFVHNYSPVNSSGSGVTALIKLFIDNLSFADSILIATLVATFFSAAYYYIFKGVIKIKLFFLILVIDLILNSWLLLPITGVNKTSVGKMQELLERSPRGFTAGQLFSNNQVNLTEEEISLIHNWAWYDKKINSSKIDYPSKFTATERFLESSDTTMIKNKQFVFAKNQSLKEIQIKRSGINSYEISFTSSINDTLVILQNKFKGWKITANNEQVQPLQVNHPFLAIPIHKNSYIIQINYAPSLIN